MNESSRGRILNADHASQIIDYSDIIINKITPTNIDGYMDVWGKGHWFFEAKYGNSIPARGQRLAFERLADKTCPFSVYIIASHNSPAHEPIKASSTIVSEVRFQKKWIRPANTMTTQEVTGRFIRYLIHGKQISK